MVLIMSDLYITLLGTEVEIVSKVKYSMYDVKNPAFKIII